MNQSFTVYGRLPGVNEITFQERRHWSFGNRLRKRAKFLCGQCVVAARLPVFHDPVRLLFRWFEPNNRRDIDNVAGACKFIIDALVDCGRIPRDSRKWVCGIAHDFPEPDPKNPRVEVTITPMPELVHKNHSDAGETLC